MGQRFLLLFKSQKINLPSDIAVISESLFAGCTSLESLVIPERTREIFSCPFQNCTSLELVNIRGEEYRSFNGDSPIKNTFQNVDGATYILNENKRYKWNTSDIQKIISRQLHEE